MDLNNFFRRFVDLLEETENYLVNNILRVGERFYELRRKYERKSLNSRNAILKWMGKYVQRKILFRDTERLLSNMPYRGRDDRAVWDCAVDRATWLLHCQLAPWKSNEALFVFWGQRVWKLGKSTEEWRFSMEDSCLSQERVYERVEMFRNVRQNVSDEVMEAVRSWLKATPKRFFLEGIRKLADRWTKCVAKRGDYVEK